MQRRVRIPDYGSFGLWRRRLHVRSCKPLHDTMTAIRHVIPVAQCGYGFVPQRHRPFKKLTPEEQAKFETKVQKALAQGKPAPEPLCAA